MGFFRFRRSIKIAPGIKINFNKKSTSLTLGRRGVHTTINKLGVRNTIGLPGSGLSYTSYKKFDKVYKFIKIKVIKKEELNEAVCWDYVW